MRRSGAATTTRSLTWWRARSCAWASPPGRPPPGKQATLVFGDQCQTLTQHHARGAGSSAGRTSWNGIPEKEDYMSFAAFMYYYAHFLDPFGDGSASPASPRSRDPETPILLLAGYSYGGLITTLLPSVQTKLAPLERPAAGSAAAEIRLRAASLAHSQNTVLSSARAAALLPKSPSLPRRKTLGVRVGGDEELGRSSHDARRSFSLEETMSDLVARAKSGVAKSHHDKKSGSAESAAAAPTTPTKKAKKKQVLSPPSPPHHS